MRTLVKLLMIGFMAICVLAIAPVAQASEDSGWCSPEYGSCGGHDGEWTPGSSDPYGSSPGGGGGAVRDGTIEYGGDFSVCGATGNEVCYDCKYFLTNNKWACSAERYSGYCSCTETYRNWILISCTSRGSCDYF